MNKVKTVQARWKQCVALLAVAFISCFTLRAAIPPAEKLLPDDTLIVVGTPDFAAVRAVYQSSPQTRLWDDPAMKPFKEKFMSKLRDEFIQPLERELGIKFDDFTSLPQGQLTFALTQNGWDGSSEQKPATIFLMDAKEKSSQLKTNLTDLRRKWVDSGKTIKTEKIREIEFTSYFLSDEDVPKTLRKILSPNAPESSDDTTNTPKTDLLVGQFESLLIVGNSSKAIEKVVAHLTGGSAPALTDVAAFEANRLLFRDAPIYGWANVKAFIDVFYKTPADSDSDTPNPLAFLNPEKLMNATGFGSLKTFAFAFQNSAEGSLAQFFISSPESSRQALFKLLPPDGKESSPPPFVPADAIKFQRSRLDGQKAWAALQKMVGDLSPELANGLKFLLDTANTAAKEKDPSFDIQKNLFGNLGDDMISYEKAPKGTTVPELSSPPSLLLIGSPHADELAAALKSIFVLMNPQGGPPTEREFLGRKIYSVAMPSFAAAAASSQRKGAPKSFSYASSGSYVALSADAGILEEYLRSSEAPKKSLRETEGLVDATQKIGGSSVGIFGYQNNLEMSRILFDLWKKAGVSASDPAPVPGMDFPAASSAFKDWMDFSLLPPFEQISKYFYISVYGVSANADGISVKMFTPTPPGLRK